MQCLSNVPHMTPALACAIVAFVASLAAVWPRVRGALRGRAEPLFSGSAFVGFALWTIHGALISSPALVAVGTIGLIATSLALSARALFSDPFRSRDRAAASRA